MSTTLSGRTLRPDAIRRSDALIAWRADTLATTGVPITQDGVVGTIVRTSTAWATDQVGRIYQVPQGFASQHSIFDAAGVRLASGTLTAPARANLVTNPDTITTAGGWTQVSTVTATSGAGPFAGRPFTAILGPAQGSVFRSVTLTGNGSKAFGFLARATGSGVSTHVLFDSTAGANRARVLLTWTNGVVTTTNVTSGVLRTVQRLADGVYWVVVRSDFCTAANGHDVYASDSNSATIPEVWLAGVTVADAPDLAMPYDQGQADLLRFTYLASAAKPLTVYHDCHPLSIGTDGQTLWAIGNTTTATNVPRLSVAVRNGALAAVYRVTNPDTLFQFATGDALGSSSVFARTGEARFNAVLSSGVPSGLPTIGQRVRTRLTLSASGALVFAQTLGTAAESIVTSASAIGMPTAWAGTTLTIGADSAGANQPALLHRGLAIAPAVLSRDVMERYA
jgi:hypothetical protein